MIPRRPLASLLPRAGTLALARAPGAATARERSRGELRTRDVLRVCADPDNLPFSNRAGEGFENRIAELLAEHLGVPLRYTWHPQTIGFIRNTLAAHRCDLVLGITAGHELVSNTRSYYRSVYVLVYRAADRGRFSSLDSPLARIARIGAVANTPPVRLLQLEGLQDNLVPYELQVDTRVTHPARRAVLDVAAGRLDMALVWGPIGAYWAKRAEVPLEWVPLRGDRRRGLPMDFRISMGVRYGEKEWLDTVNRFVRARRRDIEAILRDYGVPLLDRRGRLVDPPPWLKEPERRSQAPVVDPGPAAAPAPAPVDVTVVDTPALTRLLAGTAPLLIDVYPGAREPPPERGPGRLWLPPERATLPGAVWLPNVGAEALPDDLRDYFARALAVLTGGRSDRPLVFLCDRDCPFSRRAAVRAVRELGYRRVHWYPEGVDGWREAGRPLVRVRPFDPAAADREAG